MLLNRLSIRKYIGYLSLLYLSFSTIPPSHAQSIYLDGINDFIALSNPIELNPNSFTFSAWVKISVNTSNRRAIISNRNDALDIGYEFGLNELNQLQFRWGNDVGETLTSNVAIPENVWHHLALSFDGEVIKFYVDGVIDSKFYATLPVLNSNPLKIGASANNENNHVFGGKLDEIRIWDVAVSKNQLRYMMNQELFNNNGYVSGTIIPTDISKNEVSNLAWTSLIAYFPFRQDTTTAQFDVSESQNETNVFNSDFLNNESAPLPYISISNGNWTDIDTWSNEAGLSLPNSYSIVDENSTIDWNIITINHDVTIDNDVILGKTVKVQAAEINGNLTLNGDLTNDLGNALDVTHFLSLNGKLILDGRSELIMADGADLVSGPFGELQKEVQGTADLYTYDYWSSPVVDTSSNPDSNSFSVKNIIYNDASPVNFISSGFNGAPGSPVNIADYWIWKYANNPGFQNTVWHHVRKNGSIYAGEGFTMKGPGSGTFTDTQDYTFKGTPNNGTIELVLNAENDYLIGNPYPSAIDANKFILDNGSQSSVNDSPLLNGTLYFWEHWANNSHSAGEFRGGYASYNLSGGVGAPSIGTNDHTLATGGIPIFVPNRKIPVGQGFFVMGLNQGDITFKNSQRVYDSENSSEDFTDTRPKIRLGFDSVNTIHRQVLLTIDEEATIGKDWAYDGELFNEQVDDMFWLIDDEKFIIQGSNSLDTDTAYPLGIKISDTGLHSISIDVLENMDSNVSIYLHDIDNQTYHNLMDSEFEFFLTTGEYLEKFELTFADLNETLSQTNFKNDNLTVYYNNNNASLTVKKSQETNLKSIALFDLYGKKLTAITDISDRDYSEYPVKNLSTGTYIVNLNTISGLVSKKILVR
ncbi:MAG: LamG-like jellyroll fold domain-containing protein [Bacteroidota bacterium]